ncbi:kinesin-like protein Klp98A [Macrosteles quadrilineatus]|uniref:kinesin-like protein Klp98A n=1 Tax=Macrosteles quadrilineatus TaxID=74068 RepID=UPI0023E28A21|nr:kinesin-like protein Klp98A [Macrosteles quadrilineatus]
MASVKVAVRVRPFNQREKDMNTKLIINMEGKKTRIMSKSPDQFKDFTFDHSYWSFDEGDPHFASQEQVFRDLGKDVVDAAFEGYNACVFAYGQTGSGKTFTMTGSPDNQGLIPRICESLFRHMATGASYRTEVSYLEIYNERVKDLLRVNSSGHNLRVREHPRTGPYVSDLSRHLVSEYSHIQELMARGNAIRTTASTNMNDTSSRSHAIFTLQFVQAGFSNDVPSETVSKVHLVDLAGSERADATGATGQRLKEGAHINKSLVTLGSVISALSELSTPDGGRKSSFIPYRDSVLTWLLKDSLGGNSKTIMIAAISPAECNYSETLSTLRYANRAKNIINKPTINEDPNVKLIKDLRDEIAKLRGLLCNEMSVESPEMLATLQKKEAQEKVLTEKWAEKWRETQKILQEQKALGLRKAGTGVVLDSDMPHLIGIDDNLLSTGVTLYHLKDGETVIGSDDACPKPDIVLSGVDVEQQHCSIVLSAGVATLVPHHAAAQCWVNGCLIDKPTRLSQGCQILLGRNNMFRYNDPMEAEKLRKEGYPSNLNLSRLSLLSWSTNDLSMSQSCESLQTSCEDTDKLGKLKVQRAELIKEKEAFKIEQAEKEQDWEKEQQMKREALELAQKQLEQERQQMEEAYEAQYKRLAEDWQKLQQHQAANLASLRHKEAELDKNRQLLQCERDEEIAAITIEQQALNEVKRDIDLKKNEFKDIVAEKIEEILCLNNNFRLPERNIKPLGVLAAEKFCEGLCWMDLTFHPAASPPTSPDCWASLTSALKEGVVGEIINHHKEALAKLETELKNRTQSVAERNEKLRKIDEQIKTIDESAATENFLDNGNNCSAGQVKMLEHSYEEAQVLEKSTEESKVFKQSTEDSKVLKQSAVDALMLEQSSEECEMLKQFVEESKSSGEVKTLEQGGETITDISQKKQRMTLDLVPVVTDMTSSPETFHTAGSTSPPTMSDSGVGLGRPGDDSDEVSSTDDSGRHQHHTSYRLRFLYNRMKHHDKSEDQNLSKTMKLLMQKITRQRLHIIRSLEADIDQIDTNQEISVLQDLKREYVRLEKKLEDRGKENVRRNSDESEDASTSTEDTNSLCGTVKMDSSGHIPRSCHHMCMSTQELDHTQDSPQHLRMMQLRRQVPLSPLMNLSVSSQYMDHIPPYNYSMARSMPSLNPSYGWESSDSEPLTVRVPTYVLRGAGSNTHYAYEVRVSVAGECWAILRRYSRFRELHLQMKQKYGAKVAALNLPPRRLFSRNAEWLAQERRPQLERYLQSLLQVMTQIPSSPLSSASTKAALLQLSPFFRRGVFETSKYGTS